MALQETRTQSGVARNKGSKWRSKKLGFKVAMQKQGLKVALQETRAQSGVARN